MLKVYFTIIFCISFTHAWGQAYTAMTFNIRYDNPSDGADNWVHRKQDMLDFILKLKPSVFGIQEGLAHQVGYLDSGLSGYKYFGVGRDDGKEKGEYCAIFYHVDQHELIKSGTFWLSETPHQISVGWDAAMERICTYGMLEDKSNGQKFWVFNTHFDHHRSKLFWTLWKMASKLPRPLKVPKEHSMVSKALQKAGASTIFLPLNLLSKNIITWMLELEKTGIYPTIYP